MKFGRFEVWMHRLMTPSLPPGANIVVYAVSVRDVNECEIQILW